MHQQEELTPPFPFGPYMVETTVGRGGVGVVYKARRVSDQQVVALKVLSDPHPSETRRARFEREAQALGRVVHPGVVRILDAGQVDGRSYIAMEFVDGPALDQITAGQAIDWRRAVSLIEDIARSVDAAHQSGIIHRDIKPSNILLGKNGQPQITDFGFALDLLDPQRLTQSGLTVGTPLYMSPEQLEGRRVDPRTDVFALGVVLYELLTGDVPFHGRDPDELFRAVEAGRMTPPSRRAEGVPRELDHICTRACEFLQENRYQSASELIEDLAAVRAGRPPREPPPRVESNPEHDAAVEQAAAGRRRVWLVAAIVIGAVAGGVVALLLLSWLTGGGGGSARAGGRGVSPRGFAQLSEPDQPSFEERLERAAADRAARRREADELAASREDEISAAVGGRTLAPVAGFQVEGDRVSPRLGTKFELLPPMGNGDMAGAIVLGDLERDRLALSFELEAGPGALPPVVLEIAHRAASAGPAGARVNDAAVEVRLNDRVAGVIPSFSEESGQSRLLVTPWLRDGPNRLELRLAEGSLCAHLVSRLDLLWPKR